MANPSPKLENLINKGKGRKKGTKNKLPANLKNAFLEAFHSKEVGGTQGLTQWAKQPRNRAKFYELISKLLPKNVDIDANVHSETYEDRMRRLENEDS